jgi:hypothetical protein
MFFHSNLSSAVIVQPENIQNAQAHEKSNFMVNCGFKNVYI